MGVIDPEVEEKVMDTSTQFMRHSSAIGMWLWKMWREAKGRVSYPGLTPGNSSSNTFLTGRLLGEPNEGHAEGPGAYGHLP